MTRGVPTITEAQQDELLSLELDVQAEIEEEYTRRANIILGTNKVIHRLWAGI